LFSDLKCHGNSRRPLHAPERADELQDCAEGCDKERELGAISDAIYGY
jgi:hypothetical protein